MKKLHLVGFTPDNDGLILSPRKGAKSGGFVVSLDDALVSAIELARRRRDGELPDGSAGDQDGAASRSPSRPPSALSPREIQARLRAGSTISDVADQAGVDEEWIQRFAAPILAEQAQVVESAQRLTMAKSRRGPSIEPLAPSVQWNLSDRGVRISDDVFGDCWSAFNLHGARWAVRFAYTSRKRRQVAEWEVDLRERSLVARNRLASDLGHVEPGRRRPTAEALEDATAEPPTALPPPVTSARAARRAPAKTQARSAAKRAPAAKRVPAAKTGASAPANRRAARTAAAQRAPRQPAAKKAQAAKKAVKKAAKEAPGAVAPPAEDRPSHLGRPPSPMKFANRATSLPIHRTASPYNRPRPAPASPVPPAPSAPAGAPRDTEPANPANPRFEPRPEPAAARPAAKGASRPPAAAPVAPAIGRRPKATRPEDGETPRPAVVILSTPASGATSPAASDDDERRARLASAERLRAALTTPPAAAPGPPAEAGAGAQPDEPRSRRQSRRQAASS